MKPALKMVPEWRMLFEKSERFPVVFFKTQADFGRALVGDPEFQCDQLNSVRSFLNQIVRGARKLPESWKPTIIRIVEARATQYGLDPAPLLSVILGIATEGSFRIKSIMAAQLEARETLIINAYPIELSRARDIHAEAVQLENMVIDALSTGSRYGFCVGDVETARRLWAQLHVNAANKYGEQVATDKLKGWAQSGQCSIRVVSPLLLLQPTVAYNVSTPDHLRIFVWHAPFDWKHTLEVPEKQTGLWVAQAKIGLDQAVEVPLVQ